MSYQLPKTQYEISTGTTEDINRGKIVSRKTDEVKDFTVTIRDIDFAIKYYFQNIIKPRVEEQGRIIEVPIIYANPERWKSIQRDGYLRDEKDKLILPIIVFKRNTISKDDNYSVDKLDANNPILFYPFKKKWSSKNQYDNFAVQIGLTPTEEYYNVVMPDYVVMNYEFIVMTDTVNQMNKIVEAVLYSEGSYWGEKEKFKFRTKIQSYNTNVESGMNTQRTVKTTFDLELNGYLVPDSINKYLSIVSNNFEKTFSTKKVLFGFDVDTDFAGSTSDELTPSITSIQGGTSVIEVLSNTLTDYLATSVTKVASSSSGSTATFSSVNILQAPSGSGLTTTKENFYIFINGQYVPSTNVLSVEDSGSAVVVTFTGMVYSIDASSDSIVAVGKFQSV